MLGACGGMGRAGFLEEVVLQSLPMTRTGHCTAAPGSADSGSSAKAATTAQKTLSTPRVKTLSPSVQTCSVSTVAAPISPPGALC